MLGPQPSSSWHPCRAVVASPRVEAQAPVAWTRGASWIFSASSPSPRRRAGPRAAREGQAGMQKQVDNQKGDLDKLRDELEKKGQLLSVEARRDKQEHSSASPRRPAARRRPREGAAEKEQAAAAKVPARRRRGGGQDRQGTGLSHDRGASSKVGLIYGAPRRTSPRKSSRSSTTRCGRPRSRGRERLHARPGSPRRSAPPSTGTLSKLVRGVRPRERRAEEVSFVTGAKYHGLAAASAAGALVVGRRPRISTDHSCA